MLKANIILAVCESEKTHDSVKSNIETRGFRVEHTYILSAIP